VWHAPHPRKMRNAYEKVVRNSEPKKLLRGLRHRQENTINKVK
jgi:hypothetical protein